MAPAMGPIRRFRACARVRFSANHIRCPTMDTGFRACAREVFCVLVHRWTRANKIPRVRAREVCAWGFCDGMGVPRYARVMV